MNHFRYILFICIFGNSLTGAAQRNPVIPVGIDKTTHVLIYNRQVVKVNIGGIDGAVLYQPLVESDTLTIIDLKANNEPFKATNMLVVCSDTLFEFLLQYDPDPKITLYPFRYNGHIRKSSRGGNSWDSSPGSEQQEDSTISNGALVIPVRNFRKMQAAERNINASKAADGLVFWLDAIGTDYKYHYFKVRIRNTTMTPYHIEYMKFTVETHPKRGIGSRAAVPVQSSFPSYAEGLDNVSVIAAKEERELIYATKMLPLSKERRQQLIINVQEDADSGGRPLTLKIGAAAMKRIVKL